MSAVHAILIVTGLLGMLPLCIILYKRKRGQKILDTGIMAKARIFRISVTPKMGEKVDYCFYGEQKQLAYGSLLDDRGKYKINDVIDVYFLPGKSKRSVVQGAWKSPVLTVFGVVIAIAVWFAVYKLFEMVRNGEL